MNRFMGMSYPDSIEAGQIRNLSNLTSAAGCSLLSGQESRPKSIHDFPNEIGSRNRIIILEVAKLSDSCGSHCWVDSRNQSVPMRRQSWLQTIEAKLSSMRTLSDNWNGYGSAAPNRDAIRNAEGVINILHQKGYEAHRISPSADEGIAISFLKGERYAFIECYNDGDIAAAVFQKQGEPVTWDCGGSDSELTETIERIFEYLNG
jgi:hypothetical protein